MFHERALPDLGNNIKCGNSLIAPDFLRRKQLSLLGDSDADRVNVFDWSSEFKDVLAKGGFDLVLGNPPWISLTGRFRNEIYTEEEVAYLQEKFKGNTYMPNMYEYFIAQGLNLTKADGYFSFIVPDRFGYNAQFVDLRRRVLAECAIQSLLYKVPFPGIVADTVIFALHRRKAPASWDVAIAEYGSPAVKRKQSDIAAQPDVTFEYYVSKEVSELVKKVATAKGVVELGKLFETTSGFGGKSYLVTEKRQNKHQIRVLKGDCIGRYVVHSNYWFHFTPRNITGRTTDPAKLGVSPRILIRKTGSRIIAAYDDSGTFVEQSLYFLFNKQREVDWLYFLGLLNSRLMSAYYRTKALTNKESIAQVKKVDLDRLPVVVPDLRNKGPKTVHDQIVHLVHQMEDLARQTPRTPSERDKLERRMAAAQGDIDALVYELYGLSDREIAAAEQQA